MKAIYKARLQSQPSYTFQVSSFSLNQVSSLRKLQIRFSKFQSFEYVDYTSAENGSLNWIIDRLKNCISVVILAASQNTITNQWLVNIFPLPSISDAHLTTYSCSTQLQPCLATPSLSHPCHIVNISCCKTHWLTPQICAMAYCSAA